jgi:hypothetical protein
MALMVLLLPIMMTMLPLRLSLSMEDRSVASSDEKRHQCKCGMEPHACLRFSGAFICMYICMYIYI